MSTAEDKFYAKRLPSKPAVGPFLSQVVQGVVTTGAAQAVSILGGIAAASRPSGRCWVEIEAITADCRVHVHSLVTDLNASAANGVLIKAGEKERFWIHPSTDVFFHILSAAAGRMQWYVQSFGGEGSGQEGTPGI